MIELKLPEEIYSKDVIDNAILAYKKVAKISFIEKGKEYIISISDCKVDEKITGKEFENYLIGLENRKI